MTDPKRPADPFASIVQLATDQKLFAVESKTTTTLPSASEPTQQSTSSLTRDMTQLRDIPREPVRESSRQAQRVTSREKLRETKRIGLRQYPSRDAIQEFSFLLRDELKVKVQAEVPLDWQKELEDMAHQQDVGKLELYRYILGSFLGKIEPDEADKH